MLRRGNHSSTNDIYSYDTVYTKNKNIRKSIRRGNHSSTRGIYSYDTVYTLWKKKFVEVTTPLLMVDTALTLYIPNL